MTSLCQPYKAARQNPFLNALARIGTTAGAARAARISRDAVYDWRRTDPSFERLFKQALKKHQAADELGIETALGFFENVARRAIPQPYWARLSAELAIAVTNLKNDLKGGGRSLTVPSRKVAEFPLSPKRFVDVAIPYRGNGNSAVNL